MDKYKKHQQKKILKALGIFVFGLFGLMITLQNQSNEYSIGFMVGLTASTLVILISLLINHYKQLHSEEQLRNGYIEYSDERNQLIDVKVESVLFRILIIVLIVFTIIFAFIDFEKMVVTSSILWIMVILNVVLYTYYKKKL